MSNNIKLGDCLSFLRSLEEDSVDFTFYDPPYNVGKDYGVYKDDLSPEEYREWMLELAGLARKVSRRGFAIFVSSDLNKLFFDILPDPRLIVIVKRAAGIIKDNISIQYFSLFVEGSPVVKCSDVWDDIRLPGEGFFFKEERFGGHPGQTSKALVKKVLKHFTKPGEILLDPFLGTGTSAIAALETGRYIWGSENNPPYFEIAETRIREFESQSSFIDIMEDKKPEQRSLL